MEATLIQAGLFVHIASAIGMFSGLAVELVAGHFLVRAEDTSQARILARVALLADRVFNLALVGLLLSGPDLASRTGFFEGDGVRGWVAVAIVVIVLLGAAGAMVHRRTFKAVLALSGSGQGPLTTELRATIGEPSVWVSLHAAVGAGLSTVWLMSNKPSGVLDAVTVVIAGLGIGLVAGALVVARLRGQAATA